MMLDMARIGLKLHLILEMNVKIQTIEESALHFHTIASKLLISAQTQNTFSKTYVDGIHILRDQTRISAFGQGNSFVLLRHRVLIDCG
jgi:hypothetical protein